MRVAPIAQLNKKNASLIFAILILITRAPFLWETYIHSDEALFALSAKIWAEGGIPYVDFFETKGLGVYIFYRLSSFLFGYTKDINIQAVHLFSMIWTFLTAWVITSIGQKAYDLKRGFYAGCLFILFSSFLVPTLVATHIEVVLLLPLCLTISLVLPYETLNDRRIFCSGLCACLAFVCKYQAGILIPLVIVYLQSELLLNPTRTSLLRSIKNSMIFLFGFVIPFLVMLLYLYSKGALDAFYFWNVYGNYTYIRDGVIASHVGYQFLTIVLPFLLTTLILWILALRAILHFRRVKNQLPFQAKFNEIFLLIWLFVTFIPISVGARFEDHYFLFLLPPLSLLAAAGLNPFDSKRWKTWSKYITAVMVLLTVGFTMARYLMHPLYQFLGVDDMINYKPYADHIDQKTTPEDTMFIWGCAPLIYLQADRKPASRFLRTDVLAGRISGLKQWPENIANYKKFIMPHTWELLFEDLEKKAPRYIIDISETQLHDFKDFPMRNYPELMAWINTKYQQEESFWGAKIFRRKL